MLLFLCMIHLFDIAIPAEGDVLMTLLRRNSLQYVKACRNVDLRKDDRLSIVHVLGSYLVGHTLLGLQDIYRATKHRPVAPSDCLAHKRRSNCRRTRSIHRVLGYVTVTASRARVSESVPSGPKRGYR